MEEMIFKRYIQAGDGWPEDMPPLHWATVTPAQREVFGKSSRALNGVVVAIVTCRNGHACALRVPPHTVCPCGSFIPVPDQAVRHGLQCVQCKQTYVLKFEGMGLSPLKRYVFWKAGLLFAMQTTMEKEVAIAHAQMVRDVMDKMPWWLFLPLAGIATAIHLFRKLGRRLLGNWS